MLRGNTVHAGRIRTDLEELRITPVTLTNPSPSGLTLSRMLRSLRRHAAGEVTGAFLLVALSLIQASYGIAVPLAYRTLFDEVVPNRDPGGLIQVALRLAGVFILFNVASLLAESVSARVGTRVLNRIRERLFEQIQAVAGPSRRASDFVSCFARDAAAVETSVIRPLPILLVHVLTVALCVVFLIRVEWRLALGTLIALPLAFTLPGRLGARATESTMERRQHEDEVTATAQESASLPSVVRAFGLEGRRLSIFRGQLASLGRATEAASFRSGLVGRATTFGVEAVQILVILTGCWLATRGNLTAGSLISFVGLLLNLGGAANGLAQLLPPLIHAAESMRRIDALLAEPPLIVEAPGAETLLRFEREIRLSEVTLRREGRVVVDRVSLVVRAGQSVAFVGPSGSGKSTLLSLLMRHVDPSEGRVTVDGRDIRSISIASLRALFGVVLQDTALFNTTVPENIRIGRLDAPAAEIAAAARAARLDPAASGPEAGREREVGDMGSRLSGGQRQRVAIARVLLRNAPILALDEPTAALDPANAAAIEQRLREIEPGRTTLRVTHSLGAAAGADRIFFVAAGRIVEEGTHAELLAGRGRYHAMWHKQSGMNLSDDGSSARIEPDRLRQIPLFAPLPDRLLAELAPMFGAERVPASRLVVAEGDVGDRLFVIARGAVSVFRTSGDDEVLLRVLEEGDFFGEIALLRDEPRSAGVRTRDDCVFLTLPRRHFAALLDRAPDVHKALAEAAAGRHPL